MTLKFRTDFIKEMEKAGIETGTAEPPRYWTSTGNYALNRIISGSFMKGIPQGRLVCFAGPSGSGKAQPLSSNVLTVDGWKHMGDITTGTFVVTPSGEKAMVIGVFPQGKKDIYTFTFSDGATTQACKEHLWDCWVQNPALDELEKQTVSTEFIIDFLKNKKEKQHSKSIFIDLITPMKTEDIDLPIDPYIFGCLLSDSSSITGSTPVLTIKDGELIQSIEQKLISGYFLQQKKQSKEHIFFLQQKNPNDENNYAFQLKNLNILGKKPHEKYIPEVYKNSSVEQKLQLVRGLLDIDGVVEKEGNISFSTTSSQLAYDFQEILWSIGAKCSINVETSLYKNDYGDTIYKGSTYVLGISYRKPEYLFNLKRKKQSCPVQLQKEQYCREIINVELTSHEEAQCIMVDHPDHLYITDDYIVTHNTFITCNCIREAQKEGAFIVVGDSEHALDEEFASKIGVRVDEDHWLHADLDTIPQAQKYISGFLKSYEKEYGIGDPNAPRVLIVIDSLDMLMTEAEEENFDKGVLKGDQGQRSKQLKSVLRQFVHAIKHQNISMIVTHQVYKNQDVLNGEGLWIVNDAVKYSLSQIVLLTKLKLREDKEVTGIRMKCEGYKTRFTLPYQSVTIEVPYETGMDPFNGLLDVALNLGVVEQKGAWYQFGEKKFQSKNFAEYAPDVLLTCESKTDKFLDVSLKGDEKLDTTSGESSKKKRFVKSTEDE